jgi:hypothetical protein
LTKNFLKMIDEFQRNLCKCIRADGGESVHPLKLTEFF